MDAYQQYIHKSRYARYLPEEQRRETWEETIDRYLNFWVEKGKLTLEEANGIFADIHNLRCHAFYAGTYDCRRSSGP
jgi:hypothetical protein